MTTWGAQGWCTLVWTSSLLGLGAKVADLTFIAIKQMVFFDFH
jgi:hypothetical protein